MDYFSAMNIQQANVPMYMNNFTEENWREYNQCLRDNVMNHLIENYNQT